MTLMTQAYDCNVFVGVIWPIVKWVPRDPGWGYDKLVRDNELNLVVLPQFPVLCGYWSYAVC